MLRSGLLLVAILSSFIGISMAAGQQTVVIANVVVVCPFSANVLTPNQNTAYSVGQNIVLNYTLETLNECSINDLAGNFVISYQSNSVVVNTVSVGPLYATNIPITTYNALTFNTVKWSNTVYYATLTLSTFQETNSSTQEFTLLRSANVLINSISLTPSQIFPSTQVALTVDIDNDGQLASTGNVLLSISVTGPQSYSFTYNEPALSPLQSELATLYFSNITSQPGSYTLSANAMFTASGGITAVSSTETVTYTVSSQSSSGGRGPPPPAPFPVNIIPITVIPELNFTTLPFITSVRQGGGAVVFFGFENTATSPEYVNMSVVDGYSAFVSLSSNSVYIQPGKSVAIEMDFSSKNSTLPGVYVVPVSMMTSVVNGARTKDTEYFLFQVMPYLSNESGITSQVALLNSTRDARATIEVYSPNDRNLSGSVLHTFIPLAIAPNISDISAYGLPNNITVVNGGYVISWPIENIPMSQVAYAYISFNKIKRLNLLENIQNELVTLAPPLQSSILKILNINIPTFYTNSTNEIDVMALYTGTAPQDVYYNLNGPPGTTIYNATQCGKMNPTQISTMKFYVKTAGQPGTILLSLSINTTGFSQTDTLPVLVIESSFVAQRPEPNTVLARILAVLMYAIGTAIAVLVLYMIAKRAGSGRSRYSSDRAERLIRMRERIRESDKQWTNDEQEQR